MCRLIRKILIWSIRETINMNYGFMESMWIPIVKMKLILTH